MSLSPSVCCEGAGRYLAGGAVRRAAGQLEAVRRAPRAARVRAAPAARRLALRLPAVHLTQLKSTTITISTFYF